MSSLVSKILSIEIHDYFITLFVFVVGITFTLFIIYSVGSVTEFLEGFKEPLVFSLYYLWLKGIVLDIKRMSSKEDQGNNMPGFVFWIYALQWIIYWMIDDMVYSNSQVKSTVGMSSTVMESLYFSNRALFWGILDGISSFFLFPLRYLWCGNRDITTFVIYDCIKSIAIFTVFIFIASALL